MAKYSGEITLAKVQDGSSGVSCTGSASTYQVGTSGTVKPTGTWSSTIPSVSAGQYLWVKTTFSYSDNSTSDLYSVSYMGTNGTQGIPGVDGKSTYVHVRFSAVANPATASQISTTPDKYIGLCTNNSSTAPTSPSSYTWSKFQGDDGQDGAQGAPGVKGADGTTYYVHFAYAESADGQTGFSTTNTAGKSYIGTCTTTSATKPTTYSSYTWAKIKGDKGDTGQGIDSITPEYYVSTSNTTQTGGSWSTTMPAWAANKYCWVRNKIVYKNPASTVYTTAQLDTNWNKMNDLDSKTTVLQTTVTQEQGKLAALIKQTDTDRKNTSDKFTQMTADVNGINTTIGNIQTKVNDNTDDISSITSQITTINATAAGLETKVTKAQSDATAAGNKAIAAETKATQTADKLSWVVKSGTNSTDFTLTDRTASLIADQINLKGLVTFSGLNSDAKNKINNSLSDSVVEYALGTSSTTAPTSGWSTNSPTWTAGSFVWQRTKKTKQDGTTSYSAAVCIQGAKGEQGSQGVQGVAGADAITVKITSDSGTVFKNNKISTVLRAHVYKGGAELTSAQITSAGLTIRWFKDSSTTAIATGITYTVSEDNSTKAVTYIAKAQK